MRLNCSLFFILLLFAVSLGANQTSSYGAKKEDSHKVQAFIETEFLYWQARLDTVSFAQTGVGRQGGSPGISTFLANPPSGKIHFVDWKYDPGFRARIGCFFNQRNWDFSLNYLWLYSRASDTKVGAITTVTNLFPPVFPASNAEADTAKANWKLHYYMLGLELGRNYTVENFFKIRPFFSVTGIRHIQRYRLFYGGFQNLTNFAAFDSISKFKQSNWGIGPKLGLNATWQFVRYFGVYSNFALSAVWVHYHILRRDLLSITEEDPSEEVSPVSAKAKSTTNVVKPFFEVAAGLFIDPSVNWDTYKLFFQVGWEAHIWPNYSFYINWYENCDRFDLALYGLTAKMRFAF